MSVCRDHSDDIPLFVSAALDAKKGGQKAYRHRRTHFLLQGMMREKNKLY